MPRFIALYLPQFYPIPENDLWFGKGFTEWRSVVQAKPLFKGHYQPHLPADLGFYDLRLPEIKHAQEELAFRYGIEGFCYYHYWFGNGKQLLEKPLQDKLADKTLKLPFMLNWANGSWYKKQWRKDKTGDKVLMEQLYGDKKDIENHFYTLLPAFTDKRYIRINNKILFEIDWPSDNEDKINETIEIWRNLAQKEGIGEFCFLYHIWFYKNKIDARNQGVEKLLGKNFDMAVNSTLFNEYHITSFLSKAKNKLFANLSIKNIYDYSETVEKSLSYIDEDERIIPEIFPNFDHSPRSNGKKPIYINSTPENWGKFVKNTLNVIKDKPEEKQIVMIRAWNEWGEGNYLEPDLQYGHGYLEALKRAVDNYESK